MDSFDFSDDALEPAQNSAAIIWNILTVIVVLMIVCVCIVVGLLMVNPQISFNPYPPPTLPVEAEFPTATPTPKSVLPPTWTPAPTLFATPTPIPTNTLVPTNTETAVDTVLPPDSSPTSGTPGEGEPTSTPVIATASATPSEEMPFVLHPGDPVAINNIGHQELGCAWMGVGGRAFDLTGAPVEQGLFIQLGGTVGDESTEMLGMLGMVATYGPGSYEFVLGDEPVESTQLLWVQLLDQAMLPLSNKIYFDTFADCEKNLILINFNQVR